MECHYGVQKRNRFRKVLMQHRLGQTATSDLHEVAPAQANFPKPIIISISDNSGDHGYGHKQARLPEVGFDPRR